MRIPELIECDHPDIGGKITLEACVKNHMEAERKAVFRMKTGRPPELSPCLKCPTAIELKESEKFMKAETPNSTSISTAPEPLPNTGKISPEDSPAIKTFFCKECRKPGKNQGRGLCSACYSRLKKAGSFEKYPAQTITPRKPTRPIVLCKKCGQERPGKARGLCLSCYNTCNRNGTINQYPANPNWRKKRIAPLPGKTIVTKWALLTSPLTEKPGFLAILENYPEILNFVSQKAKKEFRNLDQQIMAELNKAMETHEFLNKNQKVIV